MVWCKRQFSGAQLRWGLACSLGISFLLLTGCGKAPPPPSAQLEIESVAKWYSKYRADHRGKCPQNEGEFVKFIEGMLSERGGAAIDMDKLMTSPRDGERWIIQYKEPSSKDPQANVAVREQTGYDGKKLIAFEVGHSFEVEEAELEELLAVE